MRKSKSSRRLLIIAAAIVAAFAFSMVVFLLKGDKTEDSVPAADTVAVPQFSADSAFVYVEAQCAFGARVPNSEAHVRCGEYIAERFRAAGLAVVEQRTMLRAYNGTQLKCLNIFASTDTAAARRILLSAHWDSRPWADNDPDENNRRKPVLAANDGASGVAVMLEIARTLMRQKPGVGVDFVCLDAEDYGVAEWDEAEYAEVSSQSWCLGTQYFAANLPVPDYRPLYAVNLDMVGGKGALFYQEGFSKRYAPTVVDKVWQAAEKAGYGSVFPKQQGGYITDDHLPLNQIAGMPAIDIVPFYPDCVSSSFGPTWHTVSDTPENIDRNILKAVGQTMLQVIYNER